MDLLDYLAATDTLLDTLLHMPPEDRGDRIGRLHAARMSVLAHNTCDVSAVRTLHALRDELSGMRERIPNQSVTSTEGRAAAPRVAAACATRPHQTAATSSTTGASGGRLIQTYRKPSRSVSRAS
jgi:hypothetical protein